MEVNVPLDIKPGQLRCPKCFSKDIVPSFPRGIVDGVMRLAKRTPRHCRSCGSRFYVTQGEIDKDAQVRAEGQKTIRKHGPNMQGF